MPTKTVIIQRDSEPAKRIDGLSAQDAAALTANIIHHADAHDDVKRGARKEIATTRWTHIDKTELQIEDEE